MIHVWMLFLCDWILSTVTHLTAHQMNAFWMVLSFANTIATMLRASIVLACLLVVIIILFLLWKIHSANNYLSLIWWFWMNICYVYTHIFGVLSKQLHFVFSISGFGHEMVAFVHPFHMNTNQLNGSLYFHTLHWYCCCTLDTYNPHKCDCYDF